VKQPIEADFDIHIRDADVEIIFKPMMSHYSFPLLAERRKVSPKANVRHLKTGDTGDYAPSDVEALALPHNCEATHLWPSAFAPDTFITLSRSNRAAEPRYSCLRLSVGLSQRCDVRH
jgi:hypothetical protein